MALTTASKSLKYRKTLKRKYVRSNKAQNGQSNNYGSGVNCVQKKDAEDTDVSVD